MLSLFRKEINGFFSSLTGYIVLLVFLLATGTFLWMIPDTEFNIITNGFASLDSFFVLAPWLFLFLIPAITMRMFAEEQRSGTIEMILTKPVTDLQIVAGKYFAAFVLVMIALFPTLIYCFSVYEIASPKGNIDLAGITGSYIGLFFLCSGFVSVGIFCSAISSNQIISFILALLLSFFLYNGFEFLSTLSGNNFFRNTLASLGINNHYISLSRGVIDSRDIIYFLSLTMLFIFLTRFIIEKRKR